MIKKDIRWFDLIWYFQISIVIVIWIWICCYQLLSILTIDFELDNLYLKYNFIKQNDLNHNKLDIGQLKSVTTLYCNGRKSNFLLHLISLNGCMISLDVTKTLFLNRLSLVVVHTLLSLIYNWHIRNYCILQTRTKK
jgi:hypothetical protein